MLERIDQVPMADEAKNHWKGVARFFRAFQYFQLVQTFGGVPWYSHSSDISDTGQVYKPRDSHQLVMDSVLADLNFAVANLRQIDLPNTINKDVALAFLSRVGLWEGTYRKYHTELNLPERINAICWPQKPLLPPLWRNLIHLVLIISRPTILIISEMTSMKLFFIKDMNPDC